MNAPVETRRRVRPIIMRVPGVVREADLLALPLERKGLDDLEARTLVVFGRLLVVITQDHEFALAGESTSKVNEGLLASVRNVTEVK